MDLATLLERCREGNELAWEALVRQHQSRVYALATHYVGNTEEARDVAQEIFIRIYQNLQRCEDAEHFVPWMIRIARNACIDHLRRRHARPPAQDVPASESHALVERAPAADETWQAQGRQRLLHLALAALGELNREIILLREIQGLSVQETAQILGVPEGTVKSRGSRARLELARKVLALSGGQYGSGPVH